MPILLLAMLGLGGYYMYEKKKDPNWSPFKSTAKTAALANVQATSAVASPSATLGLDPGMTSAQVAEVNAALLNSTDSASLYSMASNYSATYPNSAKALIAKADALTAAKGAGATDAELLTQMEQAGQTVTSSNGLTTITQPIVNGLS